MTDADRASRRVTINDVADLAGVSVATVSRALRDLDNVSEATKARVRAVAEQLNFRADPHASRLASGQTRTMGIGVPFLGPWYFGQVIAGAESVLAPVGYDLLLFSVGTAEQRSQVVRDWELFARRVDGLLLVDLQLSAEEATLLADARARVVTVGEAHPHLGAVTIDNRAAMREATCHLLDLGHREVCLMGDDETAGPLQFSVPRLRREGFREAFAHAGLPVPDGVEVAGGFTPDGAWAAAREVLARASSPTAIAAMSDEMAFGCLRAARDLGLRVPEDLSIVGIDGHDLSETFGLSTVRQPARDTGAVAASMLLGSLKDEPLVHEVLPTTLEVRRSTAPLAPHRRPQRPASATVRSADTVGGMLG